MVCICIGGARQKFLPTAKSDNKKETMNSDFSINFSDRKSDVCCLLETFMSNEIIKYRVK